MFTEPASEELLNLLTQVRLVADEEEEEELKRQQRLQALSLPSGSRASGIAALPASPDWLSYKKDEAAAAAPPLPRGRDMTMPVVVSSTSPAVGQYTASTASYVAAQTPPLPSPLEWQRGPSQQHDSSSGGVRRYNRDDDRSTRTPGTDVKVLRLESGYGAGVHQDVAGSSAFAPPTMASGLVMEEYNGYPPKQLFFTDPLPPDGLSCTPSAIFSDPARNTTPTCGREAAHCHLYNRPSERGYPVDNVEDRGGFGGGDTSLSTAVLQRLLVRCDDADIPMSMAADHREEGLTRPAYIQSNRPSDAVEWQSPPAQHAGQSRDAVAAATAARAPRRPPFSGWMGGGETPPDGPVHRDISFPQQRDGGGSPLDLLTAASSGGQQTTSAMAIQRLAEVAATRTGQPPVVNAGRAFSPPGDTRATMAEVLWGSGVDEELNQLQLEGVSLPGRGGLPPPQGGYMQQQPHHGIGHTFSQTPPMYRPHQMGGAAGNGSPQIPVDPMTAISPSVPPPNSTTPFNQLIGQANNGDIMRHSLNGASYISPPCSALNYTTGGGAISSGTFNSVGGASLFNGAFFPPRSPAPQPSASDYSREELSPLDVATAAAVARLHASTSGGGVPGKGGNGNSFPSAIRTPNTVSKPVVLTSIAQHLLPSTGAGVAGSRSTASVDLPAAPNQPTGLLGSPLFAAPQQQQQPHHTPMVGRQTTPKGAAGGGTTRRPNPPDIQQPRMANPTTAAPPLPQWTSYTSPVEEPSGATVPSCSLRPSPHPRVSGGTSPALRRYTIATPTNATSYASQGQSTTKKGAAQPATGGSEQRPRVQLSSASTTPINGGPATLAAGLHRSTAAAGSFSPAGQGAQVVSMAAVRSLIERLEAAATAAPPSSLLFSTASGSPVKDDGAVADGSEAINSMILSMSHDQHGCRLLQAVLDLESSSSDSSSAANADAAATVDGSSPVNAAVSKTPKRQQPATDATAATTDGDDGGNRSADAAMAAQQFRRSAAIQVIIRAIEPKLHTVMADGYGNFLLQKVFEMAPDDERQRLLRLPSLQHHLCEVACSPHGTFAVQRLVETVRNKEEERLVFAALEVNLLRLLTNANGGHVLMKMMERTRQQYAALTLTPDREMRVQLRERMEVLFTTIRQHLIPVCHNKQGCCIIQKCVDFFDACSPSPASSVDGSNSNSTTTTTTADDGAAVMGDELLLSSGDDLLRRLSAGHHGNHDYFTMMAALLLPHVQSLSMHPYGNYVVTCLVHCCYTRGSTTIIDAVAAAMQRELASTCTNKFASNVVEYILRHCSERRIRLICRALMTPLAKDMRGSPAMSGGAKQHQTGFMDEEISALPLTRVVMDSFGNYVIQTLLTVAPVDELVVVAATPNTAAASSGGGMLPLLQQLLPDLRARNFGRKLETKIDLTVLRVEQYLHQHAAVEGQL